jgi:hypothetical protein
LATIVRAVQHVSTVLVDAPVSVAAVEGDESVAEEVDVVVEEADVVAAEEVGVVAEEVDVNSRREIRNGGMKCKA